MIELNITKQYDTYLSQKYFQTANLIINPLAGLKS